MVTVGRDLHCPPVVYSTFNPILDRLGVVLLICSIVMYDILCFAN